MSPGTVLYRLESIHLPGDTVTPAILSSIHNCVKLNVIDTLECYTKFCFLDPLINIWSVDNGAKQDLSLVRVNLICDLYTIVLRYLNTNLNLFYFRIYF
jgi:hypothetical protein